MSKLREFSQSFNSDKNVHLREAFKKIISCQSHGDPSRCFGDLIINICTSYPAYISMDKRRCDIGYTDNTLSITDYGIGLNLTRIKQLLLLSMEGADAEGQPNKLSRFSRGFYGMLDPRLATEEIEIFTRCEGEGAHIVAYSKDNLPTISCSSTKLNLEFSTRINFSFKRTESVTECLKFATSVLFFLPITARINDKDFPSVWSEALRRGRTILCNGPLRGFLQEDEGISSVTILSGYEFVVKVGIFHFQKNGHHLANNLDDYRKFEMPYLAGYHAIINDDLMTSTILPDKHSPKFQEMNKLLKNILFEKLLKLLLQKKVEEQELLANLYALQKKIRQILYKIASSGKRPSVEEKVLSILVKEKIFAVVDQKEKISLSDIKSRLTSGMPLFFSSKGENQNWFDGDFRNDLIILPPECKVSNGAKGFYKRLFQNLFTDAIDLDHIMEDTAVLANLVDRKIIDPE